MKRVAMIFLLTAGLAAGPAIADHNGRNLFNRDNVGGAIGAAIGGFAANKIVDGKGQAAATAAGAVGGFLLGKNFARNYGGNYGHSGYSAPRETYTAPRHSSGYSDGGGYGRNVGYREHRSHDRSGCCDYDSGPRYSISPINETFAATCTSNVRAGPGTRYHVIGQVHEREPVQVIGKVNGRDWYKVRAGHRTGFIYAPLLRPVYYSQGGHGGDRW